MELIEFMGAFLFGVVQNLKKQMLELYLWPAG